MIRSQKVNRKAKNNLKKFYLKLFIVFSTFDRHFHNVSLKKEHDKTSQRD